MPFQHLSRCGAWTVLTSFILLTLPSCRSSRISAADYTSGNRYYSRRDAKFLGSDGSDSAGLWLIDVNVFKSIQNRRNGIKNEEARADLRFAQKCKITEDTYVIQTDLQKVRDSSFLKGKEFQVYIFIDRNSGVISSIRDSVGDANENLSHPNIIPSPDSGVNYPRIGNIPPDSRILIAQAHGHPAQKDSVHITGSGLSDTDRNAARGMQVPVYAIDAMDGAIGTPAKIHRADPDTKPGKSIKDKIVGKTQGKEGADATETFDIGLDAFLIWSKSDTPDFEWQTMTDKRSRKPAP